MPDINKTLSQSTIKMEKGYYCFFALLGLLVLLSSQSTIKMEKGYYTKKKAPCTASTYLSQSTIKMEKGYYINAPLTPAVVLLVAIHNKNGKGLLLKIIFLSHV